MSFLWISSEQFPGSIVFDEYHPRRSYLLLRTNHHSKKTEWITESIIRCLRTLAHYQQQRMFQNSLEINLHHPFSRLIPQEEELRAAGDPKFSHLSEDLHVEVTAFAPPAEAYARMAYALTEVRRFLVPVSYPESVGSNLRKRAGLF